MAEIAENQEKTFEYYLELPDNIRKVVIDEQEPDDRVRFTRCSNLCSQEAKASKNYIYGLSFEVIASHFVQIRVEHGRNQGYSLHYRGRNIQGVFRFCYDLVQEDERLWREIWYAAQSVFPLAIEHFEELLKIYQNKIKALSIFDRSEEIEKWDEVDFEIDNLENIENLIVYAPIDVQQFLSKIHHPLRKLYVSEEDNIPLPENYVQIMQVRTLNWQTVKLNYEQLLQFSAEKAKIALGNLTERDIFKFIRSWQDGTIGKEIERYAWYDTDSNFDDEKLFRLLRVEEDEDGYVETTIEIKHFTQDGKSATLQVTDECVLFST